MTGQRIAAALVVAGLALTGCTPEPREPKFTPPADVTCRLETVFRGWTRDPGPPPWTYPLVCDGRTYDVIYQRDESGCEKAKRGELVRLQFSRVDYWDCEVLG